VTFEPGKGAVDYHTVFQAIKKDFFEQYWYTSAPVIFTFQIDHYNCKNSNRCAYSWQKSAKRLSNGDNGRNARDSLKK